MAVYLARIDLYPIKSLDGLAVPTAQVLASGALQHDRAFALVDQSGQFVNAKRYASIQRVRSRFTNDIAQVALWVNDPSAAATFPLDRARDRVAAWFSDYFQQPISLKHNPDMGFPDDTAAPGPTVISTATLQAVADWYGLSLAETRRRFRTNLEIDGVPAFWEDQLLAESGEPVTFQIGEVVLEGINPCQRCVVPTRDSQTGAVLPGFQKRFSQARAESLPAGVARSRFNHFYRLAVNTRIAPTSSSPSLTVGDAVALGGGGSA